MTRETTAGVGIETAGFPLSEAFRQPFVDISGCAKSAQFQRLLQLPKALRRRNVTLFRPSSAVALSIDFCSIFDCIKVWLNRPFGVEG